MPDRIIDENFGPGRVVTMVDENRFLVRFDDGCVMVVSERYFKKEN